MWIVRDFRPLPPNRMLALNKRAERIKWPLSEDWKKKIEARASLPDRPEYIGG